MSSSTTDAPWWEGHGLPFNFMLRVRAEVAIRPEYRGCVADPRVAQFNGEAHAFRYGFGQGEGDLYPGEFAMVPEEPEFADRLRRGADAGWISSGDLRLVERLPPEREPGMLVSLGFEIRSTLADGSTYVATFGGASTAPVEQYLVGSGGHRREFVPPPDWGFGAHIREAVAIIRDWVRNPWRPAP